MGDFTGKKSKRNQTRTMNQMNQMIQGQVDESKAYREQAQGVADKTRKQYEDFEFSNPFENMENRFEDMTVDMRAAEFQTPQVQQQRANIMQGLRGAAGSSGVDGLAQALANQGQMQNQQISASIGQQEAANQKMRAQGQLQVQKGAADIDTAKATGQTNIDMARAQAAQQTDIATGQAAMEAQKYKLQGAADARDLTLQQKQGELSFLAGMLGAAQANRQADTAGKSDRRLKKNITKIGESNRGFNIYSFEYKD